MGHVYADITITNMDDPSKALEANALVDTGATFSVLPIALARELAIEATDTTTVETAAGPLEMELGWAIIEVGDRRTPSPVLIAEHAEHVLLGVVTLEILGLGVDPRKGELTEVNALLY